MNYLFFSSIIVLLTYILCLSYRKIAVRRGVTANLNFRTLHSEVTPKGGGITFPIIFLLSLLTFQYLNFSISTNSLYAAICALIFSTFGLWDDYRDVTSGVKLIIQIIFSVLVLFFLLPLEQLSSDFSFLILFILLLFIVIWTINSINFMDGIDGLAASLCLFYFFSTFSMSYLFSPEKPLLESLVLFSICLGFLLINFSKKNLFMGDSGSLFLGFVVSFFSIQSIQDQSFSIWYWLIILSYCLTETTLTTFYRIIYIRKWYGAHRSHAYQNLARIKNNHWKITLAIFMYHLLWLFPLAYLSISTSISPMYLVVLAIFPTSIFNIILGPRFSSE